MPAWSLEDVGEQSLLPSQRRFRCRQADSINCILLYRECPPGHCLQLPVMDEDYIGRPPKRIEGVKSSRTRRSPLRKAARRWLLPIAIHDLGQKYDYTRWDLSMPNLRQEETHLENAANTTSAPSIGLCHPVGCRVQGSGAIVIGFNLPFEMNVLRLESTRSCLLCLTGVLDTVGEGQNWQRGCCLYTMRPGRP